MLGNAHLNTRGSHGMQNHHLNQVFEPKSVAVVGASDAEDSVAGLILRNIIDGGFKGAIYPVSLNHREVAGLVCHRSIREINHAIDLVVIAIPSRTIPALMKECGEAKVGAVAIVSSGFAELGPRGRSLQKEVVHLARSYGIPLVGPDCLGVIRPRIGLNASFSRSAVHKGQVALVAQSSGFCSALLDWANSSGFGFSAVASMGATAGVKFGEVLDYLALDPQTRSILIYVENIADARAFISGLRVAARIKPVIVLKVGRSNVTDRSAVSHSSTIQGGDEAFNAAITRAGAVRVDTVSQLFSAANTLASGVRVSGPRLAVLSNSAGPAIMASDRAQDRAITLAELSEETVNQLRAVMPSHWAPHEIIDLLGDADPQRYQQCCEIVLADKGVDGVLALLTPLGMTDPSGCAEAVIAASGSSRKPILACWMGHQLVKQGHNKLHEAGIPVFSSPEAGVDSFGFLASYRANQNALLQAPPPLSENRPPDVDGAHLIIQHVIGEHRRLLSTVEAKAVLKAFRIPVSTSINVHSPAEALVAAQSLGLPVAMKINSPDITDKTEVGGVRLNIREPHSVRTAFQEMLSSVEQANPWATIDGISVESMTDKPHAREVMISISRDPVFGPVISCGAGGTAMDLVSGNHLCLPPLNGYLSRQLLEKSPVAPMLREVRNIPAADDGALIEVIQRVSEMACGLPEIVEMEINPLLVDENGVIAVDARIVVEPPKTSTAHYGHMAIHPYPPELETSLHLDDGGTITVRPIRPEDALIEQTFVEDMSDESRYFRFMNRMGKLSPLMLARFTQIDYDREMALIATHGDQDKDNRILGVARYVRNPDTHSCEFALAIADDWQKKGIGRELMQRLMTVARDRGLDIMEGDVLAQNSKMLRLCSRLGFHSKQNMDDPEVVVVSRHL
jgi:acetyltransferase